MPTIDDDLKPSLREILDEARSISGQLGFNEYAVSAHLTQWSGERSGVGTATVTVTPLTVANGDNPYVKILSQRNVMLSGGTKDDVDLEVSLTPAFTIDSTSGGIDLSTIDPVMLPNGRFELSFTVDGPGMAPGGSQFKKLGHRISSLTYILVLRKTGETV